MKGNDHDAEVDCGVTAHGNALALCAPSLLASANFTVNETREIHNPLWIDILPQIGMLTGLSGALFVTLAAQWLVSHPEYSGSDELKWNIEIAWECVITPARWLFRFFGGTWAQFGRSSEDLSFLRMAMVIAINSTVPILLGFTLGWCVRHRLRKRSVL